MGSSTMYPYEEEILRKPLSLKLWWRYLIALSDYPFLKRAVIYERALKALPRSYKLWHAYLSERLHHCRNLPISHPQQDDDDGVETLKLYSKEINMMMLDAVKARSKDADVAGKKDGGGDVAGAKSVVGDVVADVASKKDGGGGGGMAEGFDDDAYRLHLSHPQFETLNNCFERALVTMHKMPRIWIMYLTSLTEQRVLTMTRRTFDRALRALPVTQHGRVWEKYLEFVSQKGVPAVKARSKDADVARRKNGGGDVAGVKSVVPIDTSLRVYKRYLMYDPAHIEEFIEFLLEAGRWQEGAERLAGVLNDETFYSIKGKTKYRLWLELCELLTHHADEIVGLDVDAIIRGGIKKFTDEVGRLWTSLADYYIRRRLVEKARDVFEEGMATVVTVRDFSVIFNAYSQFEESMLALKMEEMDESEDGEKNEVEDGEEKEEGDDCLDVRKLLKKSEKFWVCDDKDVDLRLARLEYLMDRRPELANSVLLRQNPHNVEQWHRRVKLFEGNPTKQILTYTEAVRTVDPMKAVGKPHTLWVAFANLYENHNDIENARVIFDKAVQVNFKAVDHLASVWCEWAEMELRHNNFDCALELMRRATAEPSLEVKRRVAAEGNEPVQIKIHRSLRLWTLYVDLEEGMGTLESTREVYERILDLKIATPQIIINYAMLLESKKYFEDAFKVYERGVKIFKYPHVIDIWITYLSNFVKRYGKSKLERARQLFENAVEVAPAELVKPLYLQYARLEEDYGLSQSAMGIYDRATKAVPANEKLDMYQIYIASAAEILGVPKTREIYKQAIESGLPDKDVKVMCVKYAELEKSLGEIDRSRGLYKHASQFADPRSDPDFWTKWHEFEVQHGNEGTFHEMLRVRRSVSASYSQTHFILPEYLTQKDQVQTLEDAKDAMKKAGVNGDDMAALERQLVPAATNGTINETTRKLGFVSGGVESQGDGNQANTEDIELLEDSDSEDDDKVEIAQGDVPDAVFGVLVRKRDENAEEDEGKHEATTNGKETDAQLGALERIKKRRRVVH